MTKSLTLIKNKTATLNKKQTKSETGLHPNDSNLRCAETNLHHDNIVFQKKK